MWIFGDCQILLLNNVEGILKKNMLETTTSRIIFNFTPGIGDINALKSSMDGEESALSTFYLRERSMQTHE